LVGKHGRPVINDKLTKDKPLCNDVHSSELYRARLTFSKLLLFMKQAVSKTVLFETQLLLKKVPVKLQVDSGKVSMTKGVQ
jgi:hypothetical protein